jgi:hypothetical protein
MQLLDDLKRSVDFIDKTDWLFQKNTVNFSTHIPFENYQNEELLFLTPTSHTPF